MIITLGQIIHFLSLGFPICIYWGNWASLCGPNTRFGTRSSERNVDFPLLGIGPPALQSSSLLRFPHLWDEDLWSLPTLPLSHSRVAWLLVLMEIVKTSRKAIYEETNSSVQTHTYTQPRRGTKLLLAEQLCPCSFWGLSLVTGVTRLLKPIGSVWGSWPLLALHPQELRATLRIPEFGPAGTLLWFYYKRHYLRL